MCVPVSFHLCAFLPCAFSRLIPSVFADLFPSSSFVLSSFAPLQFPLPVNETKTQWKWCSGGGVIFLFKPFARFCFTGLWCTCLLHHAYLKDLHTGRPQLALWNSDAECPLQATLEISISRVLHTLMSGPIPGQVSVQSCPLLFFINVLLQQSITVILSQLICNVKKINIKSMHIKGDFINGDRILIGDSVVPVNSEPSLALISCRLPKALSRCISMFCWCFFSWTCWLRASTSMPITRCRVLKIRAFRVVSADLRLSAAFISVWSTGKSNLYIFSSSNEPKEGRHIKTALVTVACGKKWLQFEWIKYNIYIFLNIDRAAEDVTGNRLREGGETRSKGPLQRRQSLCTLDAHVTHWAKWHPNYVEFHLIISSDSSD